MGHCGTGFFLLGFFRIFFSVILLLVLFFPVIFSNLLSFARDPGGILSVSISLRSMCWFMELRPGDVVFEDREEDQGGDAGGEPAVVGMRPPCSVCGGAQSGASMPAAIPAAAPYRPTIGQRPVAKAALLR